MPLVVLLLNKQQGALKTIFQIRDTGQYLFGLKAVDDINLASVGNLSENLNCKNMIYCHLKEYLLSFVIDTLWYAPGNILGLPQPQKGEVMFY